MRSRLTITLKESVLRRVDGYVDGLHIRNRSHAIEYLLNKALYASQTQAILLAGGTALSAANAMLTIKNKPVLEHQITRLYEAGVREVIICVDKKDTAIENYFGTGEQWRVTINYLRDVVVPLGTGGALQQAKASIHSSPFIVQHGDVYTDMDIKDLLSFHVQHGTVATMALKSLRNVRQYGQITMRGSSVTGFGFSNLVNAGMYVCNTEVFEYFPQIKSFKFESVLKDLISKRLVAGYVYDGMWFDVGTPSEYKEALQAAR